MASCRRATLKHECNTIKVNSKLNKRTPPPRPQKSYGAGGGGLNNILKIATILPEKQLSLVQLAGCHEQRYTKIMSRATILLADVAAS
jgi:hypothetical protein